MTVTIIPIKVAGDIRPGDDIGAILVDSIRKNSVSIQSGDIMVVAQKAVSKAEGRIIDLAKIIPSKKAVFLSKKLKKDPRIVQLILDESKEIVKLQNGIIVTETRYGFVCANSGVDQSNLVADNTALLLPTDPDGSARRLQVYVKKRTSKDIAVIITDTFGRAFREGQTNVAVGVAGIKPVQSYIGKNDMFGKKLQVTEIAVADEIASAAELVMGKSRGIPLTLVRGYHFEKDAKASVKPLLRKKETDLFRRSKW